MSAARGAGRAAVGLALLWALAVSAPPAGAQPGGCGQVVSLATHGGTTTRYAFAPARGDAPPPERIALVLLVGGHGNMELDAQGCPRALAGNSLVRSRPRFHAAGFATALVDAPSDHRAEDGLGGFRIAAEHAEDLGRVIGDVRTRTGGAVWLVGTSRGAISAVNAASRLSGPAAPDGLVLTSPLMAGTSAGRKAWAAHTVFDLPLEKIRVAVLAVGHAEDKCLRSPAARLGEITARTKGVRQQVVVVTGGPGRAGPSSLEACEGRAPHGFVDQEDEVADGIARFVRGERY